MGEEIAGEDDYYWIGLSYNKTSNNGDADWRWSDGNKASGELVDDLNMQLKKSGKYSADTRMLDIEFNDGMPVERVAISSKQHGKFWKHWPTKAQIYLRIHDVQRTNQCRTQKWSICR